MGHFDEAVSPVHGLRECAGLPLGPLGGRASSWRTAGSFAAPGEDGGGGGRSSWHRVFLRQAEALQDTRVHGCWVHTLGAFDRDVLPGRQVTWVLWRPTGASLRSSSS